LRLRLRLRLCLPLPRLCLPLVVVRCELLVERAVRRLLPRLCLLLVVERSSQLRHGRRICAPVSHRQPPTAPVRKHASKDRHAKQGQNVSSLSGTANFPSHFANN
jgi:hypothetical protein